MPQYIDYAEYYDGECPAQDDIPFLLEYAQAAGSPILELACGTGRVLVPLAEADLRIDGLDLSENMLAECRRKVAARGLEGRVSLVQADMADFSLPEKNYGLAFVTFRSFMHLFDRAAQESCLRAVRRHLRPGGRFIVDLYAPNLAILAAPCDPEFAVRREFQLPNGHRVVRKDRFVKKDYANQINVSELLFEEYDAGGQMVRSRVVPLATRYTFRFELELLLEKAGFVVEAVFGDFQKHPYDGLRELIAVARRGDRATA